MNAPLPQAPRARVEKAYFRAKYYAGTAGIAIGTATWELVTLNETAHYANPAPSFAKIAAAPYTADGSVIIYDAGTYDLEYMICIDTATSDGGYGKARIRQTPTGDSETTMPYSQSTTLKTKLDYSAHGTHYIGIMQEIGARCRQEITKITKVKIEAWVSSADMVIGGDSGAVAASQQAVFAWLTVTKV